MMCASGTGRFIADSWFSDEPLPLAYTVAEAAAVRASGGVSAKTPDVAAIDRYLAQVDIPGAIEGLKRAARRMRRPARRVSGGPGAVFRGHVGSGHGDPRPRRAGPLRAVRGSPPPAGRRSHRTRRKSASAWRNCSVLRATCWRPWMPGARAIACPMASIRLLGAAVIGHFDQLAALSVVPYLPHEFALVPRANIEFLPIQDAWFSGSMNYLGRARRADGSPEYEATYEINASLETSLPEFLQLVSHEVVPGHVTTFAYLQNLYVRGEVGFEATVLTMNTRAAALFEGIANNAILMAYGVTEVDQLPDPDLQIGVLLALLQDDAKNQSSFLTWGEVAAQATVAETLRRDFLVSPERADKLSGAWGRHPLLGRMYLPAYRAGTMRIADLRRRYPASRILPALYGAHGLVDITTLERALSEDGAAKLG